jgi:hypothetical protein
VIATLFIALLRRLLNAKSTGWSGIAFSRGSSTGMCFIAEILRHTTDLHHTTSTYLE